MPRKVKTYRCCNPECGKPFKRLPSKVKDRKRTFCSFECGHYGATFSRSWDEDSLRWIIRNYWKKTRKEMAIHLGITDSSLRCMVYQLRKKGRITVDIPPASKATLAKRDPPGESKLFIYVEEEPEEIELPPEPTKKPEKIKPVRVKETVVDKTILLLPNKTTITCIQKT